MLSPEIIEICVEHQVSHDMKTLHWFPLTQNKTLFNNFRPRIHLLRCITTSGICSSSAKAPYPRNFFVMQPMTSSWASALMKNVMTVATGRDITVSEAL